MMFGNELHDSSTACGLSITQQCVESICELLQTSLLRRGPLLIATVPQWHHVCFLGAEAEAGALGEIRRSLCIAAVHHM